MSYIQREKLINLQEIYISIIDLARCVCIILLFYHLIWSTKDKRKKGALNNSLMQWITRVLCQAWCLEDMSVLPVARFPINGSKYRAKNSTGSLLLRVFSCLLRRGTVRKALQWIFRNCNVRFESASRPTR